MNFKYKPQVSYGITWPALGLLTAASILPTISLAEDLPDLVSVHDTKSQNKI